MRVKMGSLKSDLMTYLDHVEDDSQVVELVKRIKMLQTNGVQIRAAISRACLIADPVIYVTTKDKHTDNAAAKLAIRHRAKILQFRAEGYGYGKIAKLLAQRGAYNKNTGKAYSRATIQRAVALLEKGERK
jgi:hypothetical protein